jgi:hypothetical protein
MDVPAENPPAKTFIGGRHGSPSVTVAFPFSKVANVDSELRDFVEELTGLVAQLAVAPSETERGAVAVAAHNLLDRMGGPGEPG